MAGIQDAHDTRPGVEDRLHLALQLIIDDRVFDYSSRAAPVARVRWQQDLVISPHLVPVEVGGLRPVAGKVKDHPVPRRSLIRQRVKRREDRRARRRAG